MSFRTRDGHSFRVTESSVIALIVVTILDCRKVRSLMCFVFIQFPRNDLDVVEFSDRGKVKVFMLWRFLVTVFGKRVRHVNTSYFFRTDV